MIGLLIPSLVAALPLPNAADVPVECRKQMVLTIRNPEDILMSTHDGHMALPYTPPTITRLSGPGTEKALVMVARLRDERGEVVGLGTQMEYFDAQKDAEGKWLTHTSWTIQLPGKGTINAFEQERIPETLTRHLAEARSSGKEWSGLVEAQTSAGPRQDGKGTIVSGSGSFEGVGGSMVELNSFTRIAGGKIYGTSTIVLADMAVPGCNG